MRAGEIINLRWDRIDRKMGFIRQRPEDTKTIEGRKIPIDPRLEVALTALPRNIQKDGAIFTKDGQPRKELRWWHEQTCKKAKIKDFRFHDFGTQRLRTGAGREVILSLIKK